MKIKSIVSIRLFAMKKLTMRHELSNNRNPNTLPIKMQVGLTTPKLSMKLAVEINYNAYPFVQHFYPVSVNMPNRNRCKYVPRYVYRSVYSNMLCNRQWGEIIQISIRSDWIPYMSTIISICLFQCDLFH